MDAVFRLGIDTPFSPSIIDDLSMEGSVENPIVLDEEEDKENAPPPPSTPESVTPREPPTLQRSCSFGARLENVPDYVFRNLFQYVLPCLCFTINYKYCVSFYHNISQKIVRNV